MWLIQEANGLHAEVARIFDVLPGHIGLGAVCGYAHDARAGVVGGLEVVHGADARQQQRRDLGMPDRAGHGLDPLEIGMGAEAVVEAAALQAVAMGHLDGVDPGLVERLGDLPGLFHAVLVADGVAAVAQRNVGNVDLLVE